ncbi:hypothetical protein D3C76_1207910 [compost metagenome]
MRNAFEDTVLFYAFARRFAVGYRITRTAVQQTVVAPGRAGGDIMTLQQYATQSAACAVTSNARAGRAAANDDHIRFVFC